MSIKKKSKEFSSFLGRFLLSIFGFFRVQWKNHKSINNNPVLLVHGYLNSKIVWLYHGSHLKKAKIGPIYTMNLGWPFSSIETYSKKLKKKIKQIRKENNNKKVILVGHSMGGLVCSYYSLFDDKNNSVSKIISIASPYKGTPNAKIGIGKCTKEMEPGSKFLKKLTKKITKEKKINFYYIAAMHDHIVFPVGTSILSKKRSYVIENAGHASLLFSKKANNKLKKWLINN